MEAIGGEALSCEPVINSFSLTLVALSIAFALSVSRARSISLSFSSRASALSRPTVRRMSLLAIELPRGAQPQLFEDTSDGVGKPTLMFLALESLGAQDPANRRNHYVPAAPVVGPLP